MTLFHRRPGGVSPTEAGRVLTQHAQSIMESVREARLAVEELADGVTGEVRVGTANSVGIYFLPHVLWSMREKYPVARPTVLYRHSNEILELLLSNRLDVALVANPRRDRRLQQEMIIEERVSLVCGRSHPFFGKEAVGHSDLRGLQLISLSAKSPTGQLIRDYLTQLQVEVEPVISTDNVETVKKMVEFGLGVAFLPDMVTRADILGNEGSSGKLTRIRVDPPLYRTISMVTWKHYERTKATCALMEEIRRHASEWQGGRETENIEPPDIKSA